MANNSILAKMAVQISANGAEFNKALADMGVKLNGFEQNFKRIGATLAAGLGFASVSQGFTTVVERIADFNHAMSSVKAITGATGKDFEDLRNNALNLGGAFRAIDIAKLETEFARLGFSTKEILDSTKATIQLATATGEDLAKSAQIAGSVIRAFNLDAGQMGRVGDIMASGFNKSALSLNDFGEAMKYVAPVASNAGLSLEQVTAALGVLADANIKGSMAGTSFRKIISDLGQGSAPVFAQKLREMAAAGIKGAEAMDEVGRTAYASLLVLANNIDKLDSYTKAAENSKGELELMSAVMQDDLIGDWNKFNAALDQTIQKGTPLERGLRNIANAATSILDALNGNKDAQALGNLKSDADGLNALFKTGFTNRAAYSANFASGNQETIFKILEKDAEKAGVSLKAYLKDYDLIKATLFGNGPIGPNPATKTKLSPFGDPNAKKSTAFDKYGMSEATSLLGTGWVDEAKNIAASDAALKQITETFRASTAGYIEMFHAQDLSDDEYKNFHEEVAPEVQAEVDGLINKYDAMKNKQLNLGLSMRQMGSLMRNELNSLAASFGQLIGNLASGMNGQDLSKMLLGELGNVVTQLGKMLIAVGIGVEAFKESLASLNGPVAIAAGIALVAVGTAFTNRAQSAASGGGGSSAAVARAADQMKVQPINITVSGTLEMSGNGKLRAQIQKANYINGRTGG